MAPILRPSVSATKLDAAAGDVYYELEQMVLAAGRSPGEDVHLRNMLIEAFLLHYRNVRDFLFPPLATLTMPARRNRKAHEVALDTVIAFDFAPDWKQTSEQYVGVYPHERKRIDKRLAHISYSRQELGGDWNLPAMTRAICGKFGEFLKQIPPDGRSRLEPTSHFIR